MNLRPFGLLLLLGSLGARAADLPAPPPADFAASFVQTRTLPGFDAALTSRGDMSYDKSKGFRWEITSPYHYLFEMGGGKAHEELPDGTRRDLDPDQTPWLAAVQHIFISALSGDRSQLESYFSVAQGADAHQLVLTPKPGPIANAIRRIEVTESAPGRPERLTLYESAGGKMDIRFTPSGAPAP
jgi:hypothetical protein